MRALLATAALLAVAPAAAGAQQPPIVTNPLGMEFVLVQPGSFPVGRMAPICRRPGAGGGGGGGGAAAQGNRPPAAVGPGQPGASATPPAGRAPGPAGAPPQPARTPPDPRSQWTEEDYARCDEMARAAARPGFTATVDRPFQIGRYEVTQGQWKRVMGTNPSTFQGDRLSDDGDRHPVETVTWEDAQAFIARLNQLDPTARYRLPTEFEWELAARAGSKADGILAADARRQAQTSRSGPTFMVGQKEPNAYGIYDMFGNVWEWVEDFYNEKVFPDPVPPLTGSLHVLKGAGFLGDPKNLTWTYHGAGPGNRWDVGFRVVREPR